jgi:HK97 family phage prohead protease
MSEQTREPIYLDAEIVAETAEEERAAASKGGSGRTVHVVASTGALDSHGSVLRQNWDLKRFEQNPVVLFAHKRDELPIATARKVQVKGSKKERRLEADVEFPPPGKFARSDEVWDAIDAGLLRGVSVGFVPHTVLFEEHEDREVTVLDDLELLELSIVPVGSNPETLSEQRAAVIAQYRETHGAKAPTEEQPMPETKIVATTPTEAERVAAANAEALRTILDALGVTTADAARGAVEALRASSEALKTSEARVAELEKASEERDRASLVAKLEAEKRITPAQREGFCKTASLETLRAFAETAPIIVGASQHREPAATAPAKAAAAERWNGKTFAELTPNERHALYLEDADLYRRLRDGN